MKICIVSGNRQYHNLFESLGHEIVTLSSAELVVFTGGEDVTPSLYGDAKHPYTGNSERRDAQEKKVFEFCIGQDIPMVGICRGAQFLNVMSGGRMYQHVERHTQPHNLTDVTTGEVVYVSSTHHQMMMPGEDATIVAVAYQEGSREWYDGEVAKRDISKEDIEVLFYPKNKVLCFQPHPEFGQQDWPEMYSYFANLLTRHLLVVNNTDTCKRIDHSRVCTEC